MQMDAEVTDGKGELITLDTSSDQMPCIQLLATSIEDARSKKKTLVSKMQSVWKLIQEVECEERVVEIANQEVESPLRMDKLNQELLQAEETKNMLLRKLHEEKEDTATKTESLYRRVGHMLDVGDQSLDVLTEMRKALKMKLTSAMSNKEIAKVKMLEKEAALASKEIQIKKVEDDIKILKEQTLENSKLQEFLKDHDHVTDMLNWEISDIYENVKMLKLL